MKKKPTKSKTGASSGIGTIDASKAGTSSSVVGKSAIESELPGNASQVSSTLDPVTGEFVDQVPDEQPSTSAQQVTKVSSGDVAKDVQHRSHTKNKGTKKDTAPVANANASLEHMANVIENISAKVGSERPRDPFAEVIARKMEHMQDEEKLEAINYFWSWIETKYPVSEVEYEVVTISADDA